VKAYFSGSRLKIKRADKHVLELQSLISDYEQGNFYRLFIEKNPQTGQNLIGVETVALPTDLPLIIGDALHNLHSALELMAFEIVTRANQTPSKNLYFPWSRNLQELEGTLKNGEIRAAPAPVSKILLDTIAPDTGMGERNPLHALHTLDIEDKHRLLIPVISEITVTGAAIEGPGVTIRDNTFILKAGQKAGLISIPGELKITDHGKGTALIAFNEAGIFQANPVIQTLHLLSQFVTGVLDAVTKTYL